MIFQYVVFYLLVLLLFLGVPTLLFLIYERLVETELRSRKSYRGRCVFGDGEQGLLLRQTALTGKAIQYSIRKSDQIVCKEHAKAAYYNNQKHTITKGWWSLSGIIRTPAHLLANTSQYLAHRRLISRLSS